MTNAFQKFSIVVKELSPVAKLLVLSLAVLLIMSLFVVSLYTRRPAMVPLGLHNDIDPAVHSRAIQNLESRGIQYDARGNEIYVPRGQKLAVLASLTESNVLAGDQINFDALIEQSSPFLTRDQNRQRFLVAKMNVLASMISQMNGIERATVVLDQPEGIAGIGQARIPASASVTVVSQTEELTQSQVDAIAQLVSRAQSGLSPEHVAIVDARTGRAFRVHEEDMTANGRYLEVKRAAENHVQSTLETALSYVPNVRIAVNAQVDTKQVVSQTSTFEDPKFGITQERSWESLTTNQNRGFEPGVRSNIGASIAVGDRSGKQSSDEQTETVGVSVFPRTESHIRDSKGYALKVNATIGVPKSYFIRLFQDRSGDSTSIPDENTLNTLALEETQRIQNDIMPLIDTEALEGAVAGVVTVSMIPDFAFVSSESSPEAIASSAQLAAVGRGNQFISNLALGGLAALALLVMLYVIRHAIVASHNPQSIGWQAGSESNDVKPVFEGVEVDEHTIRRTELVNQLTRFVNRKPEKAGEVFKKWMNGPA